MAKLKSFIFISLNGFYKGANEDIHWHPHDIEEILFSRENLKSDNILLFGRITYEMMKSFWPTAMALKLYPEVANGMNNSKKMVISKTLKTSDWKNTTIIKGDLFTEIRKLKEVSNQGITVLGSGNVLRQLANENLIDEYQIIIAPVFIETGTPILNNLKKQLTLELINSRTFKNGTISLTYKPKA